MSFRLSEERLAITYLVEDAVHPWGGVQTVFRQADALAARGHAVTILCRSRAPDWYEPRCDLRCVSSFDASSTPDADLVVGTWCTTVPAALQAKTGRAVHFCQGYEGDDPLHEAQLWTIERIYRLPTAKVTISPFLARRLAELFGVDAAVVPYGIHDALFRPGETSTTAPTSESSTLRVGLIGPWTVTWKDIPTGVEAVRRAAEHIDLTLVRVSPDPISDPEREAWGDLDVETHEAFSLEQMADLYRSLDIFVGTSTGGAEGFFLPAVEAMASGVPCVLSDIECFRHYGPDGLQTPVDEEYAKYVAAGDAAAFAAAILELARDPEQRAHLRASGLRAAAAHAFDRHVEAVEARFLEIASGTDQAGERVERERAILVHRLIEHALDAHGANQKLEADAAAKAAVTLDGSSTDALLALARFAAERDEISLARSTFDRALEGCARTPELAQLDGRLYLASGDADAAARCLQDAIDLGHPGSQPARELAVALRMRAHAIAR